MNERLKVQRKRFGVSDSCRCELQPTLLSTLRFVTLSTRFFCAKMHRNEYKYVAIEFIHNSSLRFGLETRINHY